MTTERPTTRIEWTPRQRQVLELLARGYTNREIGERLGVSLDGAKWHVGEILSKLGVESREAAAEYWVRENRLVVRYGRRFRAGFAQGRWRWWLAGSAAAAAVVGGVLAIVVLLSGGDDTGAPAQPDLTTPTNAPAPSPTPTASPTPRTPPAVVPTVTGVTSQPRDLTVDREVTLTAPGASPFRAWDGVSTVLYDMVDLKEIGLGPGTLGSFSPDGRWFAWVAGKVTTTPEGFQDLAGEAWALELATGRRVSLGPARLAQFIGPDTVAVFEGRQPVRGEWPVTSVNLATGERKPIDGNDALRLTTDVQQAPTSTTADGYRVADVTTDLNPHLRTFAVTDTTNGATVLRFDANFASPGGPGEVIAGYDREGVAPNVPNRMNLFSIDIATGRATFLLAAGITRRAAADSRWVAVGEGICLAQHSVLLLDRTTGNVTRLNLPGETTSNIAFDRRGHLVVGSLVAFMAVIDLGGGPRYVARAPELAPGASGGGGYVVWSPDFRYASRGWAVGPTDSC